jgi:hypothetical protein
MSHNQQLTNNYIISHCHAQKYINQEFYSLEIFNPPSIIKNKNTCPFKPGQFNIFLVRIKYLFLEIAWMMVDGVHEFFYHVCF